MAHGAAAQQSTYIPATSPRDNIATTISNIRLLRGVPDGTVSCRGNRAGPRPMIRCEVRYVDTIAVTGIEITERDNPANIWTASFRPIMHEDDEAAYFLIVDRSDAVRAPSIRRSAHDLAELFFRVTPKQRVAVAAFDTKLDVLQDFTSDGKAVAAALDKIRPGNETAELYRLSLEAVEKLGQQDAPRKVLVIVSDGKFDDTVYNHAQVVQAANRMNVQIVSIGYHDRTADFRNLQSLRRLSADTRGFFFETPGPQRSITPRGRNDFLSRLHAGVVIEAEALARGVPPALHISLRHPQGAVTSLTVLLHPGVASPDGTSDATTRIGDGGFLRRASAWLFDDLTRTAAIFAGIAILSFGFLVSGFAWRRSRRGRKIKEASALPAAAPATPAQSGPLAWLEFNGKPGTVPIGASRTSIGRGEDNDVVTDANEAGVSLHHAVIARAADGSFQISSRSGDGSDAGPILVNGAQRESARMADGDVVKLGAGNYGFLFREAREDDG